MNSSQRGLQTLIVSAMLIVFSVSIAAQRSAQVGEGTPIVAPARIPSPAFSNGNASRSRLGALNNRPTARQRTPITENELLSGVNLSDEQKASIDRIHHEMRSKMEIVSKDQNESPEQKAAMLEGMNRMQMQQVFDVLKPEQREDVRKKILAARSAARQEQKTSSEQKIQH